MLRLMMDIPLLVELAVDCILLNSGTCHQCKYHTPIIELYYKELNRQQSV